MRKTILTIAIVVMGFTAVFAQDSTKKAKMDMRKQTPEQRAERSTAMLDKKLSLTTDQKAKIYQINLDRAKKMEAMRSGGKDAVKGNAKQMKADMEASNMQLEQVLTPEQKTKYDAMREEMKDKMQDRMKDKTKGGKQGKGYGEKEKPPVVSSPPSQG